MDSLVGKIDKFQIKEALREIQTGSGAYNKAYKKAMERIEQQSKEQTQLAKRLVSWLTFSQRPLTLSELQHALAIKVKDQEQRLDEDRLPDIEEMLSVCAGLVSYNERNHIVELVHRTTKEFFESEGIRDFPTPHLYIGEACVTYLCYDSFASGCCLTEEHYKERCQKYPFHKYAAQKWGYHAKKKSLDLSLTLGLLKSVKKLAACAQSFMCDSGIFHNVRDASREFTGLQLAIDFGLEAETEALLDGHHKTKKHPHHLNNLLFKAVLQGHSAIVEILLRHGASLDHVDDLDRTVLFVAAQHGHQSIIKLLLQRGMDPNSFDGEGHCPLSRASENGHLISVKLLVDAGAVVQPRAILNGRPGVDPLTIAVFNGHEAVVRLLNERGAALNMAASVHDRDGPGNRIVKLTLLIMAIEEGHTEVVQLLLDLGVNRHETDSDGNTPLGQAAAYGHEGIVHILLASGANINQTNVNGYTPLELATRSYHLGVMRILLEHSADPNLYKEHSLLYIAVDLGDPGMINLLLDYKAKDLPGRLNEEESADNANLEFETETGPPLKAHEIPKMPDNATWELGGNKEIIRILIRRGLWPSSIGCLNRSLLWAAKNGSAELIEVLLEEGADINATSPHGDTPLLVAAMRDETFRKSVNWPVPGHRNQIFHLVLSPFTGALNHLGGTQNAIKGSGDSPGIILANTKGVNLEARDENGLTALSNAAKLGNIDLVKVLVEKGASMSSRDAFGQTALHHAIERRNGIIADFLLAEDPSLVSHCDDFGRSPELLRRTSMSATANHRDTQSILGDPGNVLRTICSPGYDQSEGRGRMLFLWAAKSGHIDIVKTLSDKGISHSCENEVGNTPFILAIQNGHIPVIEFFSSIRGLSKRKG